MPEPEQPQESGRAALPSAEQTTEWESETVVELLAFLRKEMAVSGESETTKLRALLTNDTEFRALLREKMARERAKADINRIIARLDAEIPEAHKAMDALLSRLRTTRIA